MSDAARDRALVEPVDRLAGGKRQVHLIGFMGSGKTTVGLLLARRLLWSFLDLDVLVERHAGMQIAEIFRREGEAGFRSHERFVLRQAVQKPRTVVALGGGTFVDARNVDVSRRHGVSVWLHCPFATILERLDTGAGDRPLWDAASAPRMLEERSASYSQADLRVDAAAGPGQVAERVVRALGITEP